MKTLLIFGILFSLNSLAEISYTCSNDHWNRAEFQGNNFLVEIQVICETSIDVADQDKMKLLMVSRFQNAPDVVEVHEVGEREYEGIIGTFIISNLKQSIPNRGDMNVKFDHFVAGDEGHVQTESKSLSIQATGYSRFTKEVIRRRMISVVDGKVQIIIRDFNRIEKPRIAPRSIFERSAKKGLSDNTKRKIKFLIDYLDGNL